MTRSALQAFRTAHDGCEIAALADISTRTVLIWDAAVKWPQEQLDALSNLAAQTLRIGSDEGAKAGLQVVLLARSTGCYLFRRAAPGSGEVLCCIFAPHSDVGVAYDAAGAVCANLLASGDVVGT